MVPNSLAPQWWSIDQEPQHQLGAHYKCRTSGPTGLSETESALTSRSTGVWCTGDTHQSKSPDQPLRGSVILGKFLLTEPQFPHLKMKVFRYSLRGHQPLEGTEAWEVTLKHHEYFNYVINTTDLY